MEIPAASAAEEVFSRVQVAVEDLLAAQGATNGSAAPSQLLHPVSAPGGGAASVPQDQQGAATQLADLQVG